MGTRWGAPPRGMSGGLACLPVPGLGCCVTGDPAGETGRQAIFPAPCLQYKPGKSKMCQGQDPGSRPAQSWSQRDTGDIFLTPAVIRHTLKQGGCQPLWFPLWVAIKTQFIFSITRLVLL